MLQAYLDGMSELLSDEKRPLHRAELGDRLSTVARARTLTVLSRLDGERIGNVVQFLYESGLIFGRRPVLALRDANLRGANLRGADLRKADLRVTNLRDADLENADLSHASLDDADLRDADLRVTDLYKADLRHADLPCAFLIGADLRHADLRDADLYYANLSGARLYKADLEGASLVNANLRAAVGWTDDQLLKAKSLQGATMPNGQKYEEWLKDKEGSAEKGKDGGTS
jgi:uncharacterized protein YjbI with pentapeptide repeats